MTPRTNDPVEGPSRWSAAIAAGLVLVMTAGPIAHAVSRGRYGLTSEPEIATHVALFVAFSSFTVTGALLIWRRPRHRVGWLLAAIGVLPGVFAPLASYGEFALKTGADPNWLGVLGLWGNTWYWYVMLALVGVFVPLLFPTGRLPSRRWRPYAAVPMVTTAVMVAAGMLSPTLEGERTSVALANPIGVAGMPDLEQELGFLFLGLLFGMGMAIVSVVVRFRRSRGAERQQLKVFLSAAALLPVIPLGDLLPVGGNGEWVFAPVIAMQPIAITIAVLRHRLYDIDRLISRTVSYTLLTSLLAAMYATLVVVARAWTGTGGDAPDIVVAGATLLVASLFHPLRRRIQRGVDRRFARGHYDGEMITAAFATHVRAAVDLDRTVAELGSAVRAALSPASAGLWMAPRHTDGHAPSSVTGARSGPG